MVELRCGNCGGVVRHRLARSEDKVLGWCQRCFAVRELTAVERQQAAKVIQALEASPA